MEYLQSIIVYPFKLQENTSTTATIKNLNENLTSNTA